MIQRICFCDQQQNTQYHRRLCQECNKSHINKFKESDINNEDEYQQIIEIFKSNTVQLMKNIELKLQIQQYMLNEDMIEYLNLWIIKQIKIQEILNKTLKFNNDELEKINIVEYMKHLNQKNTQIYEYLEQFQQKINNIDDQTNNALKNSKFKQQFNPSQEDSDEIQMAHQMKIFLAKQNSQRVQQDDLFQTELEKYLAQQKIQNQGRNQNFDDNADNNTDDNIDLQKEWFFQSMQQQLYDVQNDNTDDNIDLQKDCFSLSSQEQLQEDQQYILQKNNTDVQSIKSQKNSNQEQQPLEITQNKKEEFKNNQLNQFKEKLLTEDQDSQTNQSIIIIPQQMRCQEFFQMNIDLILSAAISFDEKYIGFCCYVGQLQVFIIEENQFQKLKEIKAPSSCIFKPNSHQLISGSHYGWIFCFDGQDQFKIQFQQQVHNETINCIILIDESTIITCSKDKSIIITDLQNSQQLLKISDAHQHNIMFIDYNKSMEIIASCSVDQSIKLWNLSGNLIQAINQAHQDFIMQIQIIEQNRCLLSLCLKGQLKLWDFQSQQDKIEFKSILEKNEKVLYFHQEKSNLILVCQNYLRILNINYQVVRIININMNNIDNCNQLNYKFLNKDIHGQVTQANPGNIFIINGKECIMGVKKILEQ